MNKRKTGTKNRRGDSKHISPSKTRACWKDYDFSYLKDKPKSIQRLAALYEYGRESDTFISAITRTKNHGWSYRNSVDFVYPPAERNFLSNIPGFPDLSFEKMLDKGLPVALPKGNDVEVEPASDFFDRFEFYRKLGDCATIEQFLLFYPVLGSVYVVTVPWKDFPATLLADGVAKGLLKQRRRETSGKMRPGRKGLSQTRSGMDLLHQLGVYRWVSGGGEFKTRPPYFRDSSRDSFIGSPRGWRKAFKAADLRIRALPQKYLFS